MKKRERNAKRAQEKSQKAAAASDSDSDSDGEAHEIEHLNERIQAIAPALGSQASRYIVDVWIVSFFLLYSIVCCWTFCSGETLRFDSLPISTPTLKALASANLTVATDIQAAALPHALVGRDILGAAKTGSGKTLGNSK